MNSFSVLVGGKAGDGINEAGMLIARILNQLGYRLYIYYDYPSLIRGGHNFSLVRAAEDKIGAHRDQVDILIALNQETLELHQKKLKKGSTIIFDSQQVKAQEVKAQGEGIALGKIMKELMAPPIMRNTCILGAFCRVAGIPWEILEGVVKKQLTKLTEMNLRVAQRGYQAASERLKLEPLKQEPLPILTGNEAIGMGLIHGGIEAYVAYPMTPTSNLLHFLAKVAEDFQIKVIHPENEIGVMLMALGFAYAGKRSAVGTSGGGFCLMTEGLSLAGQAELPITVVMGQRTGPSTGLPTYTAQGDLLFVISAGQGEFPRLVVAPGDAEEAYRWSSLALDLSWKYQLPAFILSDKTLSEGAYSFEAPEPWERMSPVLWDGGGSYQRYQYTGSGVSPLSYPPLEKQAVKSNGYTHDQLGITTEDPKETASMAEKRLLKERSLISELERMETVKVYGQGKAALICWGSTKGACIEAAQSFDLRVVRPLVLWPYPSKEFMKALEGAEKTVCAETNSTGQLARLIRSQGFSVDSAILKYDGRPFSTDELEARLAKVLA